MAYLQINFLSQCLMRNVTFSAVVPGDKSIFPGMPVREKKPFKTLYLLHGIFGSYTDWTSSTRIQAWAENKGLAVIMPSGDNSFYVDNEARGDYYGEFIGKELVSYTRSLLPLSHKREDTFIAGLSMGGYGAIRNGLKYFETFGCIAGISSALITDSAPNSTNNTPTIIGKKSYYESVFGDLDKLKGSDKDPKAIVTNLISNNSPIPDIYLCCGTGDFILNENRDFHMFLNANNVRHTYVEGSGAHNWDYWEANIQKVLDWLPLEKHSVGNRILN